MPVPAPPSLASLGSALEGSVAERIERDRDRTRARRIVCLAAASGVVAVVARHAGADPRVALDARHGGAAPPATAAPLPPSTIVPVTEPPSASPERPATVTDPASILVLVDKSHRLPPGWQPTDLVVPDVDFTFDGFHPRRQLRAEAAHALESLFAAAAAAGLPLAGVSGFRSEQTQRTLFDGYVERDGLEAASRYSARPGHSEHQTGLAIDVAGIDGRCQAEPCFADTDEAHWIAAHAAVFGFVVRYPAGKEGVTGYVYEPWHIRYVGVTTAREIVARNATLEELLG